MSVWRSLTHPLPKQARHHIGVPKHLRQPAPESGRIYRDFDGQLVQLVAVKKNLCTWVPVSREQAWGQVTHRDNFVRRFKPLKRWTAA